MCVISIHRLAMAEAEDLLTALWYSAEEQGIPSPRLRAYQVDESLDLHIEFLSEEDGQLMRRVVPRLATEPCVPGLMSMRLYHARSYPQFVQILFSTQGSTKTNQA
jgi:hypothetical protein